MFACQAVHLHFPSFLFLACLALSCYTHRCLTHLLVQARDAYGTLADPQEKAALTAMLAPLQALAERLSSAATLTPMSPPPQGMASGILTAMVGNAAGMGGADGAAGAQQQHNDPMLGVVEGLNGALVVDSGLRDFAVSKCVVFGLWCEACV